MGLQEDEMLSLFKLSGFTVTRHYELANEYWPRPPSDQESRSDHSWIQYLWLRNNSPWWLVFVKELPGGPIKLGWRKNVLSINWYDTGFLLPDQNCITDDKNITRDTHMIHAWSMVKALEYLTVLGSYVLTKSLESVPVLLSDAAGTYRA